MSGGRRSAVGAADFVSQPACNARGQIGGAHGNRGAARGVARKPEGHAACRSAGQLLQNVGPGQGAFKIRRGHFRKNAQVCFLIRASKSFFFLLGVL